MKSAALNTSHKEQNHHQFKKADDAPQKNIKQPALLQKENKPKLPYTLSKEYQDADKWITNFMNRNNSPQKIWDIA